MYSKSQLAVKWFQYFVSASNSSGHGIHSPFVYELIREVFNDNRDYYAYKLIETAKKSLLQDNRLVQVSEFGAGAVTRKNEQKKISSIAKTALSEQKFGRLLFRLANYYHAKNILELGTSLGISTAYLASADASCRVVTLEGSSSIGKIAAETFYKLKLGNIQQVSGDFNATLSETIAVNSPSDLVFIDGNHRKKPVLDYFEQLLNKISASSVIIIHDIHWSKDMEDAWDTIQKHSAVKMSVDIFSAGLVFFRSEFQVKQHFTIRF